MHICIFISALFNLSHIKTSVHIYTLFFSVHILVKKNCSYQEHLEHSQKNPLKHHTARTLLNFIHVTSLVFLRPVSSLGSICQPLNSEGVTAPICLSFQRSDRLRDDGGETACTTGYSQSLSLLRVVVSPGHRGSQVCNKWEDKGRMLVCFIVHQSAKRVAEGQEAAQLSWHSSCARSAGFTPVSVCMCVFVPVVYSWWWAPMWVSIKRIYENLHRC